MDEEELEQPRKKITISNFFESIQSIDKVANRALKKTKSNLGIISKNKSLIEALSKSFDTIKTEIKEIKTEVKEYITIEKDLDKDKLFAQEDQEQKIKRLERLQGIEGDKVDPADAAAGTTDDSEFQKKAGETVKKALQNPDVVSILTGLIGLSVAGLMGAGEEAVEDVKEAVEDVKERKFSEKTGGVLDSLSGNLTDFDRRGGKPVGVSGAATGIIDFFTANMFDLDKRGGLFESKESFERREKINEKIKEEKKNRPKKGLMRLLPFKFGTEIGGVDGPDGIDRIPAMLTKGETVLSKDESENLKEMGVFNVDKLVSGVKKMYNKDDEVDKFSFEMMKKFEGYSETAYPDVVDDDGNVLQYAIGYGSSFLPPFITGEEKSRPVKKGDKITNKQATQLKEYDIDRIQDTINSELSEVGLKLDDLPVRVSSVLTSLGFNYGSLEGVHPLKDRKFNEGKLDTDKSKFTQSVVQMIKSGHDKKDFTNLANFLEFNKSQDEPGTGLEARRKDESLIIKTGSGSDYYGLQNLNIPKLPESSNNLQSVIESKSDQLAQNIFTPPTTQSNNLNLLPIPITQQQSQPISGNVSVPSPIVSPQVSTTPVTSTMSTVSFINMISNKQLSVG